MTLPQRYIAECPEFPWLSLDDPQGVEAYLTAQGWLGEDEAVASIEKAGEGNMNLTFSITTNIREMVLKQARPWVEKYDHIAAPGDRILFEIAFYERVKTLRRVAQAMPGVLHADTAGRAMLMERLPGAADMASVYQDQSITNEELAFFARWLGELHTATRGPSAPAFANRDMRTLNHEHIFVVPLLGENGLDLDGIEPGLAAAARILKNDAPYREGIETLGRRYLADGDCLLHGDYYPGSWLRTDDGPRIIDPEFCFYGDPEFDVGVCCAHFRLAELPVDGARHFLSNYTAIQPQLDEKSLGQYAASEVMRRLIGVAQLPLTPSAGGRAALLGTSRVAFLEGDLEGLWE